MLSLPVYLRGSRYYFHSRISGKQFKKSLDTSDPLLAKLRAVELLRLIAMNKPRLSDFNLGSSPLSRYELDLSRGIAKASDPEDHERLMAALTLLKQAGAGSGAEAGGLGLKAQNRPQGLKLLVLLDKLFTLKTHLKEATGVAYKAVIQEFSQFLKNPDVNRIGVSDVTRYQEYLASKKNTSRTIDSKIGTVRLLMNFAIKQGYYFEKNPAENRNLLTKKQKMTGGYAIFDDLEIDTLLNSKFLNDAKTADPDYYWCVILGLITGCRVSEITSLTADQFKISKAGTRFITLLDSKTNAGLREIPIPNALFEGGLHTFLSGKSQVFRYKIRLGKGSGNAVGKMFSRNILAENITRPKLVFHSLRKYCNDFFLKNGIEFEPRCQFFGHETNSVNVQTYSNKLTVDDLGRRVFGVQSALLKRAGYNPASI